MWTEDNNYEEPIINQNNNKSNNKNKKINKKFIIIGIVIFILFLLLFSSNSNPYSKYENNLVEQAKIFVKEKGVTSTREYYIDNTLLNIDIGNCYKYSGVFVNGDSYIPYLKCDDYKSKIFDNKGYTLNGDEVTIIPRGVGYTDLGININGNYKTTGEVKDFEGVYNIAYNINNQIIYRKVVVIEDNDLLNLYPKITLEGENTIIIYEGEEYIEKGYFCNDSIDGNITNKVNINNEININEVGDYKVIYSVTNSRGNTTNISRIVRVVPKEETTITFIKDNNKTIGNVPITIIVSGTNYVGMDIYQNNMFLSSSSDNSYMITVNDNVKITVKAYDKDGTVTEKDIDVDNIDRSSPEGTCVAVLTDTNLTINVYTNSNNPIDGYDYIIDDYESDYRNTNIFTRVVKKANNVKVNIKDKLGNIGTINCTVSDKTNGFTTTFTGRNKHLNENIVTALQRKGHTVGDLNSCITNKVKEYGAGTRKGVAAAGVALIECTYQMTGHTIPYNHTSGNLTYCPKAVVSDLCGKLGINTYWGTPGGTCRDGDSQCYHGLNCGSFVRWAFCNGGMDHCNSVSNGEGFNSSTFFPEMYGFEYYEGKIKYKGTKDITQGKTVTQLVSMLKPGDIISWVKPHQSGASSAHVMLVVGNDGKYIYYAEDGDNILRKSISSYSGFSTDTKYKFSFLDDYYANQSHKNKLY